MDYRICFALTLFLLTVTPIDSLIEHERLEEYNARNYSWPLPNYVPDTPGWRNVLSRRFDQLERIEDNNIRYNLWLSTITSALVAPNFTETGWGLTRAPEGIMEELRQSLQNGMVNARQEVKTNVIEYKDDGAARPLFISQPQLNDKVLRTLLPYHEAWAGIPLQGHQAYGLRVYRNDSSLLMHVDRPNTHIISSITHVDHSPDSEPWPIIIEDYYGNTNEVVLESGDMLFYESSKCLHGRPAKFKGSWYSSIFTHYSPVNWDTQNRYLESHYAVPPHWHIRKEETEGLDRLVGVGTGMKEPDCEDIWCGLKNSVKWAGPAKEGMVITAGYEREFVVADGKEERNDEL